MRPWFLFFLVVCALGCLGLAGCDTPQAREVESTGHGQLLFPTQAEQKAGYR
jgi:hypothetical protein